MKTKGLHLRVVLFAAMIAILGASAAEAGKKAGDVVFFFGGKSLESAWGEVGLDQQFAFGVEMSWGNTDWPVWIATDLFVSGVIDDSETDADWKGLTTEVDIGVRKFFEFDRIRPYVGGGIAFITGYIEQDCLVIFPATCMDEDDGGAGVGPWLQGGALFRLGSRFDIGLSLRWSMADATLFDRDVDAGGFQYGVVIGWGWPKHE